MYDPVIDGNIVTESGGAAVRGIEGLIQEALTREIMFKLDDRILRKLRGPDAESIIEQIIIDSRPPSLWRRLINRFN